MPRLGVLGWPVRHSRSPAMHNAALRELGLDDWIYQRLPVPSELFEATVRGLAAAGFVGANVTIPHKNAALETADQASDAARAIGAANTLSFEDSAIIAENTDAPGLMAALPQPVVGRRAVVFGAGGSARAAVWALRDAGAARVTIWNRTQERARRLAQEFGADAADGAPPPADLLINCSAAGLEDPRSTFATLPIGPADLDRYGCVVDLVYGEQETPLVSAARAAGATVVDGLAVLVRQGALSLERWTGRPAPLAVMREALGLG
ncbi:MAG TPA: shikimate dehydrogenase [Solirubrobacteraceae bacterium]|nr:shikimate dehydrogenase [Solirubrobacteraceae bacterium]